MSAVTVRPEHHLQLLYIYTGITLQQASLLQSIVKAKTSLLQSIVLYDIYVCKSQRLRKAQTLHPCPLAHPSSNSYRPT